MIVINGRWLTFAELWCGEDWGPRAGLDVIQFRLAPQPVPGAACMPFHSLCNELAATEAAIFARFGKTNRYKINRAQSRDRLAFECFEDCAGQIDAFCAFYDAFARQKSLELAYRRGLEAAARAGRLVLTRACRDGAPLVWHAYIRSGDSVALLHSASHFRAAADADRALVARANRWLHWRDMLEFKRGGAMRYDWGGVFDDESVPQQAAINNFKREFGGEPHRAYTCTLALTLRGRMYAALRHWLARGAAVRAGVRGLCP